MQENFNNWLIENNLSEVLTTNAGDTLYLNNEKRYLVLKKFGEYNTRAFYLDDIVEFNTYDDEKHVAYWIRGGSGGSKERSTSHSTNEVFMKIKLRDQSVVRLQIFKAKNKNIERDSQTHVNLFTYACQISQRIYDLATK